MIRSKTDFSLKPKPGRKHGNLRRVGKKNVIHCRFFHTVNGKKMEVKRSTDCTQERDAQTVAFNIWQHETGKARPGDVAPAKLHSTAPKLGAVTAFLLENQTACFHRAKEPAIKGYVQALARAVILVTDKAGWESQNLSILTDSFVHQWRAAKYKARGLDMAKPRDIDMHLNSNLNSEWNNVKACFGKQALQAMLDAGMDLPASLYRFLAVPRLDQEVDGFAPIDPAVDFKMQVCAQAAIHRARGLDYQVPDDWPVPSGNVGVVYEMARFAGLTQKEIVGAWRGWLAKDLTSINVAPYTDSNEVNFQTKANAKNGRVPTNPVRVRYWLEALGTSGEYLLPGTKPTHRVDLCRREANKWIGAFLPDRIKRLHDLRKQAGSDVYQASASLSAAAAFIRDSEVTARKYYLPKGHNAGKFGVVGL